MARSILTQTFRCAGKRWRFKVEGADVRVDEYDKGDADGPAWKVHSEGRLAVSSPLVLRPIFGYLRTPPEMSSLVLRLVVHAIPRGDVAEWVGRPEVDRAALDRRVAAKMGLDPQTYRQLLDAGMVHCYLGRHWVPREQTDTNHVCRGCRSRRSSAAEQQPAEAA